MLKSFYCTLDDITSAGGVTAFYNMRHPIKWNDVARITYPAAAICSNEGMATNEATSDRTGDFLTLEYFHLT
jgi:hypothetical protein